MLDGFRLALLAPPWHRSGAKDLNLATDPAGGYRAFFLLSCMAVVAVLATGGWLAATYRSNEGPPGELLARERELLAEQSDLGQRGAAASATLQSDRAAEILERTAFLNELLVRKSVSWTRTFLDIEKVLPPDVRVLTIEPQVAYGDTIRLDMTVSAKAPGDFIEFLRTLEGSELFGAAALRGSSPPGDNDPTFRYRLAVEYDQQL